MAFNPSQGDAKMESKLKRALFALPFLGLAYFFKVIMDVTPMWPVLVGVMETGKVTWDTGSTPILSEFYHVKFLDELYYEILPSEYCILLTAM